MSNLPKNTLSNKVLLILRFLFLFLESQEALLSYLSIVILQKYLKRYVMKDAAWENV